MADDRKTWAEGAESRHDSACGHADCPCYQAALDGAVTRIQQRVEGSALGAKRRRTGRSFYAGLVSARELVRSSAVTVSGEGSQQ